MSTMSRPACKGKTEISDHRMVVVGDCEHHPKGSVRNYEASICQDCGVGVHRSRIFGCGPRIKEIRPSVETCAVLRARSSEGAS